jgi:predicted MPP superfamily phosphohydrolase
VKKLTTNNSQKIKRIVTVLFWIVPFLLISGLLLFAIPDFIHPANFLAYFHFISGTFLLFYIPKFVFILFNLSDDLLLLFKMIFNGKKEKKREVEAKGKPISRNQFLTRVGIIIGGVPFLTIAYGIKWGRFNFTIREYSVSFPDLPASFDGLRIVQVSDFHIGSFMNNPQKVGEAVEIINQQDADLLLFTGDFVNNVSSEMNNFVPILNKMSANIGKYSILGNHDYGDYVPWSSAKEKRKNLETLIHLQKDIGFKMLLNNSQKIKLNGDEIELLGVENWGLPPFPQHGDLNKALSNTNPESFKILMSHDPTHWDEQVLNHTDINLTLSGHTHGAQFGIEIPGWRWSPVNIRYKRWGGMYKAGNQHLNVNTGIGFIGFPGRVGMPPEITVIELKRKDMLL